WPAIAVELAPSRRGRPAIRASTGDPMSSRLLAICLLTLALTSLVTAQPSSTTAPATTQASVKADQSTPRGALKSLTVAMNNGDAAGIKSVFSPTGDVENKMVDAVVNQQQALMKFRDAAVTAFGADEARKLTGDLDAAQAE